MKLSNHPAERSIESFRVVPEVLIRAALAKREVAICSMSRGGLILFARRQIRFRLDGTREWRRTCRTGVFLAAFKLQLAVAETINQRALVKAAFCRRLFPTVSCNSSSRRVIIVPRAPSNRDEIVDFWLIGHYTFQTWWQKRFIDLHIFLRAVQRRIVWWWII
jgi:hypothetical protein